MESRLVSNPTKSRYSYLVRGVALFFVLFMGFDAAFPQYCSEVAAAFRFNESVTALPIGDDAQANSQEVALVSASDSHQKQSPDGAPHGGHCVTFCSHVMLGTTVTTVTPTAYMRSTPTFVRDTFPVSPPLQGLFRPPKLA